jgi:enoyl-CoA hydratase/carnithine racemase
MANPSSAEFVLIERPLERVAHVILNRPERRNALTGPLADQLAETLESLNTDESLNAIVIRGAGNAFCSGLDLKEFAADPQPDWVPDFGKKWRRVHAAVFDSPHIIVGALERAAVNGGAALALACDFLVAGDGAFLQVGEIQQGMAAPMNMAWLRLRFPENVAARLTLLGDRVLGPELVRLGIAFLSVPDEHVLDTVAELTARFDSHDPDGVVRIKRTLRRSMVPETADEWFARFLATDPLKTATTRPIAAKDA